MFRYLECMESDQQQQEVSKRYGSSWTMEFELNLKAFQRALKQVYQLQKQLRIASHQMNSLEQLANKKIDTLLTHHKVISELEILPDTISEIGNDNIDEIFLFRDYIFDFLDQLEEEAEKIIRSSRFTYKSDSNEHFFKLTETRKANSC